MDLSPVVRIGGPPWTVWSGQGLAAIEDPAGTLYVADAYAYFLAPWEATGPPESPQETAEWIPNDRHHGTVNALYVDGHVKGSPCRKIGGKSTYQPWTTTAD